VPNRLATALTTLVLLLCTAATDPKTGSVRGTLAGSDGEPIAGAMVALMPPAPTTAPTTAPVAGRGRASVLAQTRSDDKGQFRFTGLAAGTYEVRARADADRRRVGGRAAATVEPGQEAELALKLQPATRRARRGGAAGETTTPPAPGERHTTRLRIGDKAPDFTLPAVDQKTQVKLSELHARKPVVLVFGSFTCPPFRERVLQVEQLSQQYPDRAHFLMVYIREAHPDSTIRVMEDGVAVLKKIMQTDDLQARAHNAQLCGITLKLSFPAVIDKEDNAVNAAFAGLPSRIVVVDSQGKVAFDGGPGPAGFQPSQLEQWLKAHPPAK
jgi:thiol-disulfide isomerase/thioredoxin